MRVNYDSLLSSPELELTVFVLLVAGAQEFKIIYPITSGEYYNCH